MKLAYREGARARELQKEKSTCPYRRMTEGWSWWMAGWNDYQKKGAPRTGCPLTEEQVTQACDQYAAGMGLVAISALTGAIAGTIRARLISRGVTLRPRGKRPAMATS